MSRRKSKGQDLSFEEAFAGVPEDRVAPPRKFTAFLGFLFVPVVMGLIAGLSQLPLLMMTPAAVDSVQNYWDELPDELPEVIPPQRSVILDANGDVMAEFFAENRVPVSLDEVSPHVIDALIATEDRAFYEHEGVDYHGIMRAIVNNLRGKNLQGASTITQQLVKNTLLINARTEEERAAATEISISRKMEEISYAIHLEETLTKDEILERYLNFALYSNGVYGIGTAADYYFSKPAADLTVAESAMLIGLLKNPTGYDPIDHPDAAKNRRNLVLSLMLSEDKITQDQYDEAVESDLGLNLNPPKNGCAAADDPYYCQWILNSIASDPAYGETPEERADLIYWGGLTIQTYYDPELAAELQKTADQALGRDNRVGTGIAVTVPGTGAVPGFAQNRTWGSDGTNDKGDRLTQVIYPDRVSFQSGSTFKVFTLLAALEAGFSADTVITAPGAYKDPNMNTPPGGITNNTAGATGPMNAYTATARSSNTWYAELQERVGVLAVADMAESLGIDVPREGPRAVTSKDASFTLGTISVSPLQMSAAYAAIAAGGVYCEPHGIQSMTGPDGSDMPVADGRCRRVMSPQTATTATAVLREPVQGDDELRTAKTITMDRPVAGKTGTTNRATEVWFVGFTPQYATAVWVGDPRGAQQYPLSDGFRFYGSWMGSGMYGSSVSAPVWKQAMDGIHAGLPKENFRSALGTSLGNIIPDVTGMDINAAYSLLTAQGYNVSIADEQAEATEVSKPDHVAAQTPAGGSSRPARTADVVLIPTAGSKVYALDPNVVADNETD